MSPVSMAAESGFYGRTTLLFVYGTLRRGHRNFAARRLHARAAYVGEASLPGRLRALGPYRALERGPGRVSGEVFRISPTLFRGLNEYEGADFGLRRSPARTSSGDRLVVWAYWGR